MTMGNFNRAALLNVVAPGSVTIGLPRTCASQMWHYCTNSRPTAGSFAIVDKYTQFHRSS